MSRCTGRLRTLTRLGLAVVLGVGTGSASAQTSTPPEWALTVAAELPDGREDRSTAFGIHPDAQVGSDVFDQPEPPPPVTATYVRAYSARPGWVGPFDEYDREVQPPLAPGDVRAWPLEVEATPGAVTVTWSLRRESALTQGLLFSFVDAQGVRRPILDGDTYRFVSDGAAVALNVEVRRPLPVPSVTLDGSAGWRMLASPEPTTIGAFLDPFWTQGFTGADDPAAACNVYTFAEPAASFPAGWTCVSSATDDLPRGEGLMVYVFEDDDPRASAPGIQNPFPKTLAASSAIAPTGDFAFSLAFTDDARPLAQKGWNLLGAPFGTSMDWDAVTRSGVTPTVYVYDPAFEGGAYRTYTSEGGTGAGDLAGGLVPPFQGFFAKAYLPTPSLVLPEDGGTADGQDVYGRFGLGEPPLPPEAPAQSVTGATATGDAPDAVTALGPVAPNPATGAATVHWTLAETGAARVAVVDLLGREVAVLASGTFAAGPQRSQVPAGLAPGVYVVRLTAGPVAEAARFTVVR